MQAAFVRLIFTAEGYFMKRHTATLVLQAHSNRALSLFDYSPDPGDVVGFVWSTAEAAMVTLARRASSLRCLYLVKLARRATLRCANGCNETSSVGTRGCEFATWPCDGTQDGLLRVTFSSMIKGIGSKTWLQSQLSGNCVFHDSSLGVSERGNSNLSKHVFIVSL